MNDRIALEQLDRQVGEWLRDESWNQAPVGLVEDVFAQTTRTRQVRRWPISLPWTGEPAPVREQPGPWRLTAGLAGTVAVALVIVTIALVLRPGWLGPAATPAPSPTPTPSPSPSGPVSSGPPAPVPTTFGTVAASSLFLGDNAGPISMVQAFGSLWVSSIDAGTVRRFNPATMEEEVPPIRVQGPGWFAVADGALWVTHQGGIGLARIDPATNTVVAEVGEDPPCAAPFVAFDSLWQSACDGGVILRIDPTRNEVVDRIPAAGYGFLVLAGGRLITDGPGGLAALDPETHAFTQLGYPEAVGAQLVQSDGESVWVLGTTDLVRVDPATGAVLATFPDVAARGAAFGDGRAWLTMAGEGVGEIDLATNAIGRVIPVPGAPNLPYEADGVLWVTDFSGNQLWRIEP